MKLFTFKLKEPTKDGLKNVALIAHNEDEARVRALKAGWDIVNSDEEDRFLRALNDAMKK